MLRFHRRSRPVPYQSRSAKRKLLFYVLLLGLIYFLTVKAADPRTWYWLSPEPNAMLGADGQLEDTVLPPPPRVERPLGGFTAAPAERPAPSEQLPPLLAGHFPGVRQDLLADLRDDDFFRPREHAAFFHLLKLLRDTDDAALAAASTGKVAYAQLYRQPASYRGEVVTVRGTVRRCTLLAAPPNDYGIAEYYEVWLQPDDNPTYPLKVYALAKPQDFPTGDDLREAADITGFFYRRLAYKAQDEPRTAPLVLARGIAWRPASAAPPAEEAATLFSIIAAGVTVLLVGIVLFLTRNRALPRRAAPVAVERALADLKYADLAPSPAEALRQMTEQAHAEPATDALLLPPRGEAR